MWWILWTILAIVLILLYLRIGVFIASVLISVGRPHRGLPKESTINVILLILFWPILVFILYFISK